MLIEFVELINFGSYVQERIHFTPGTNAIVGANGSGKSTIREAVAFALFNKASHKLSALLREGARSGTVTVGLISSLDDRHYEIERRFTGKTTTRYGVYDAEAGRQCLAGGVINVEEWVRQHLRIDASVNLGTLFETTIGVPQGTFTAPFLLAPSHRKDIFDRVLDVDSYKRASDNLRPSVRLLAEQAATHRTEIARLEGMLSGLPALHDEDKLLEGDISYLGELIATDRDSLASAEENFRKLNEAETVAKKAEQTVTEARVRFDAQEATVKTARRLMLESSTAKQALQDNLAAHTAYVDADNRLQGLDSSRRTRAGILQLEHTARQNLAPLTAAKARLPEFQRRVDLTGERTAEIEAELVQASHLQQELAAIQDQIKHTQEALDDIQVKRGGLETEICALAEQCRFLDDPNVTVCPTCGSDLTPEHRAQLLQPRAQALVALKEKQAWGVKASTYQMDQMAQQQKIQGETHDALRRLSSNRDLLRARQNLKARQDELAVLQERVAGAAAAQKVVDGFAQELARYADLDAQLSRFQDQRRENQAAHDTYMTNLTLAGQVGKHQDEHREAQLERAKLDQAYKTASAAYEVARAGYDAQMHANVQRDTSNLRSKLAAWEAQVRLKRERLTLVKKSLAYLETAQGDLDKVTTELQETEETHATIQWGRELLREAGPLVTRRLVRQISQEASGIYGELRGDSGRRLQWSEDYELSLDGRGYRRTFGLLSGGEQMLAALAVRWALLRATSAIDIAFYDEPTTNLDPVSRQAVAAIIARLKGPSQKFVMSHVGTFESEADNCVHIVKDETGSHVAA